MSPSNPLPPNTNPSFPADYAEAIVYPAHPDNYYRPENHGGVPNRPRGWVLHTPEEPADDNESTPRYFAEAPRGASTLYYLDSDGDVYQLVPERCAAIANGVVGKPYPSWADPRTSLNWQSLNVEIEGYGHSLHLTMPRGGKQWDGLLRLIRDRSAAHGLPLTRENIIGHYQVSNERSDPGPLFPWTALIEDLNQEDDMYNQHDVWALNDLEVAPGQRFPVNAREVFGVPAQAKRIDLELFSKSGYGVILHGDTQSQAGRCGWSRTPATSDGYETVRSVCLDDDGQFYIWSEDTKSPVNFYVVHCGAWY